MNDHQNENDMKDADEYNPLSVGDTPPTQKHDLSATDSPIQLLFNSPSAVKIIAIFLLDATFDLTVNEIETRTELQEETVRNELAELTTLNIIEKTVENPDQYTVNTNHAVTTNLKELEWELEPIRNNLIETRKNQENNT